jgi:dihydrofolate synthase/folylpolyglutamate synthase
VDKPGLRWFESLRDFELQREGNLPNLDAIRAMLDAIADPQDAYRVIHITGTNGKGSVAYFATQLALALGMSVGTFTSPHLESIGERIVVNGLALEAGGLEDELFSLMAIHDSLGLLPLTKFEALTAAAFSHFALAGVELAIVEVGMGGTWDATNVADGEVAIITSVGLDHQRELGDSIAKIAEVKSGIIKANSTVLTGALVPEASEVVARVASNVGVPVKSIGQSIRVEDPARGVGGWYCEIVTEHERYDDLFVGVHGRHQLDNVGLAIAAVEAIGGSKLPKDAVRAAFHEATPPGRVEVLGREPLVIADVAHNTMAAEVLGRTLLEEFGTRSGWVVVAAIAQGRDPGEFLSALGASAIDELYAVNVDAPQVDPVDVAHDASRLGIRSHLGGDIDEFLPKLLGNVREDQLVLIVGGHRVVGGARRILSQR